MTPPSETPKLVLVIDDDDGIRELLTFLVKKEGFRSESAVDGEDGYRKAEALSPDLIVLDLMMPRYGGFEVLRQLQAGGLAKTPIVVVTGRYTDRSTAEMIRQESNVVDFLEKPLKPAAFAAVLARLLGPRAPEAA
ncbi:MAG: response regulator [Elusimicrobiota bacterium]|nr:MAG: response regulator [Elusimicrobiota bacterium]